MGSTKVAPREKLNKAAMTKLLQEENDFVTNLLLICDVPYTAATDETDELYINMKGTSANRKLAKLTGAPKKEEVDEDVKTEIMANKMKNKKNKASERGLKKKEAKKAKEQNKLKKTLISAGKALKNGLMKQDKSSADNATEDKKPDKKLPFKPVYNADGKLVYSKFDFAAGTTSLIKGKKKGQKSAEVMLQEIKKKDKEIKTLMATGEKAKALEIKNDIAWKKAFDKVEGKKVKDDVELLKKTIHKKEVKKLKSKANWDDRKKKEEHKLDVKVKRRNDNLGKRNDDRKKKKMKRLNKRGRVVGF